MASITITIQDGRDLRVQVSTDAARPVVGAPLTPAEQLAMELLGTSHRRHADVVYDPARVPLVALAMDLLHPEQLGLAVPAEVRDRARRSLGRLAPTEAEVIAARLAGGVDPLSHLRKAAAL
ncbi:MAG: hypothetical protein JSR41_09860 [Proteobacteria bacterium]|nr:hypothetical protein [Pseudomonadota bacterium]